MQAKSKMKIIQMLSLFSLLLGFTDSFALPNTLDVSIQGAEAKKLFTYLSGPKVHPDAGMSKQYLQGINVVCQYVTAPISHNGINVPMGDPSRYSCNMNFDYNGLAGLTKLP
jgi:hypothetical protein